ncbi:hypothetical protein BDF19DRAFT_411191 [Syncephalis fuscata]|nr:hypothetical protein BDF19DRAFT_411191 [Syncephalis fuscata]
MATKYPIIISANNLAETLALEHAALALCLLIYLGYTVVISRCRTCREHFDSPANVLAQSTSNVVPGTQPSAAHLKLKEETKSRVVTMAAMLTCAISLILRVIPLLYPASSLVDARNVILAGTNALIFTLSSAHPGRVRMIFLLDVLADTLLLMAIWLALARQAFALHIASRNGGHTLVLGHYWRIFSPMAGWTCVAVAVVAVPCTELLTFLLFDRYATSTMGFKNLASSALASSHQPIFIYNRVDNYDNVTSSQNQIGAYNHTGVM